MCIADDYLAGDVVGGARGPWDRNQRGRGREPGKGSGERAGTGHVVLDRSGRVGLAQNRSPQLRQARDPKVAVNNGSDGWIGRL